MNIEVWHRLPLGNDLICSWQATQYGEQDLRAFQDDGAAALLHRDTVTGKHDGVAEALLAPQQDGLAEIVVGFAIQRPQLDGTAEMDEGLVALTPIAQDIAKVVVRLGILGHQL